MWLLKRESLDIRYLSQAMLDMRRSATRGLLMSRRTQRTFFIPASILVSLETQVRLNDNKKKRYMYIYVYITLCIYRTGKPSQFC